MLTKEELATHRAIQRLGQKIPELSLRDIFAISVINGTLRGTTYTEKEIEIKTEQAYRIADAMLEAREKK